MSAMNEQPLVSISRVDRVARVRLNRPEKLNALNTALVDQATTALRGFAADRQTVVIVLSGEGRAFSAGADLQEMRLFTAERAHAFITRLHELIDTVRRLPQVVVASIHGHCYGGAMELAAACDLRIAADTAVFGMPEIRVGMPSVIEAALLVPLIGLGRTTELVLTGNLIGATKAEHIGFLSYMEPDAYLEQATHDLAERLTRLSGPALRSQKRLVQDWFGEAYDHAIERGIDVFAGAWRSPNPREAIDAFLAHRPPSFRES